jgi:uncharacterized protein
VGRVITLIVLALIAYLVIKGMSRRRGRPARRDMPPERMVACGHCGVNLPASEAVADGGAYFCCEEHRRRGVA